VKLIKRPFKEAENETIKETNHLELPTLDVIRHKECAFVLTNPIKPQKPTEPEAAAPKISKIQFAQD
jgi:hypothetical protein